MPVSTFDLAWEDFNSDGISRTACVVKESGSLIAWKKLLTGAVYVPTSALCQVYVLTIVFPSAVPVRERSEADTLAGTVT